MESAHKQSKLTVTVLSGFLGAGKTTLLNYLLKEQHGYRIAVIVNDMSEINIDAQLVKQGGLQRPEEKLVEMQNGCICCTLREDLLIEVAKLARSGCFDYLLIESTGISEPLPVAETFTFADEEGVSLSDIATLDTMVTVVDGVNFLRDYESRDSLADRGSTAGDQDERDVVDLLIEQIEFCNVLCLSKVDLLKPAAVAKLEAILHHLNPDAKIIYSDRGKVPLDAIFNTGLFDFERAESAPGWLKELRGEHTPETQAYGIRSFVYRARRPFHPSRFAAYVEKPWKGVLRSKGFAWLATRSDWVAIWSQAGKTCSLEPGGKWWATVPKEQWPEEEALRQTLLNDFHPQWGDRRQELVFIGINMDEQKLRAGLDRCLLSDEELARGPSGWLAMDDLLPQWEVADSDDEAV
jgi:G3E family GTPase